MTAPGPNWYDVLDVDPTATTDEIRAAWRASIADLTPADRRFRLYNEAAEVLLDPARREAYDATLVADEPEPEPAPVTTEGPELQSQPGYQPTPAVPAERRPLPLVPTWLLAALGVLAALAVGVAAYLFTTPSPDAVDEATASARAAAERAIVPVLSYDFRDLDGTREAAQAVLTPAYRQDEYDRFFTEIVEANAERTKTIVRTEFVASAVVRGGAERVEVLLFVDRTETNAAITRPVVTRDQVRALMVSVDGEWLIDCLVTTPDGTCAG